MVVAVSLVGAMTAGYLLSRPLVYQATATVRVSSLVLANSNNDEHSRAIDEFGAALNAEPVLEAAGKPAGLAPATLGAKIQYVVPSNSGFVVNVVYSSTIQATAEGVVRRAAVAAMNFLARQRLDEAITADATAQRNLATALSQLAAMARSAGAVDVAVKNLGVDLSGLLDIAARSGTSTNVTGALASTTAALQRATAAEPAYASLLAAFNQAVTVAQATGATKYAAQAGVPKAVADVGAVSVLPQPGHTKSAAIGGFVAGAVALLVALLVIARREIDALAAPDGTGRPLPLEHDKWSGADIDGNGAPDGRESARVREGGATRRRSLHLQVRVPPRVLTVAGLTVLVPVGLVAGLAVTTLIHASHSVVAIALAFPIGAAAMILALKRFELFICFLLTIRASIDSIGGGGALAPSSAVGTLFILAGGLWLLTQREIGRWRKPSALTKWLWVFAAACALSVPTSVRPAFSAQSTLKVISGVLMFSILEQYLSQRPRRVATVLGCLILSSVLPMLLGLAQAGSGRGNTNYVDVSRVMANFSHPSTYATYLLLIAPLLLVRGFSTRGVRRLAFWGAAAVAGTLVILTYTRAAWLAVLVIPLYLGLRVWRQLLWALLVGVVIVVIAAPSVLGRLADLGGHSTVPAGVPSNSLAWRVGYWEQVIPLANSNPVTGIGFDAVQKVTAAQLQPHNGFVEAYAETGIVGLIAICGVIVSMVRYLRRRLAAAHPGSEQMLALIAVAAAIGVACQFPVENLLTQTYVYWYLAAVMTFGYPVDPDARFPLQNLASAWMDAVKGPQPEMSGAVATGAGGAP